MRYARYIWLLLALIVVLGAVFLYREHLADEQEAMRAQAEASARRAQAAQERAVEIVAAVEEESRALMPRLIAGVAIGMDENELRHVRPHLQAAHAAHEPGKDWLEETLANGAQILYSLDQHSHRVLQVQVLSVLPSHDAITPHLAAMNDTYGTPTGVWDCPASDGLTTRRFTWRKNLASLMDVFLIYGDRVSLTLYIAPTETIANSLALSRCRPVARENLDSFPLANPAAMRSRAEAAGPQNPRVVPQPSAPGRTITVGAGSGHP